MVTKLTLSAEAEVVRRLKRVAAAQGTSVSAMFDRFARSVAGSGDAKTVGRLTKQATGIVKIPKKRSDRRLLEDAILAKHGLS